MRPAGLLVTLLMAAGLVLAAAAPARSQMGRWSARPANPCKLKPGSKTGTCDRHGNWIVSNLDGDVLHAPDGRRFRLLPALPATK